MDNMADGNVKNTEPKNGTRAEKFLSELNKGFRRSKAQQILRLLRDQDELNHRFRECALVDDNADKNADDDDNWSTAGSDASVHETEKKLAQCLDLRKQRGGRSKTSMGFYNDLDHDDFSDDDSNSQVSVYRDGARVPASRDSQVSASVSKRSVSFRGSQISGESDVAEFHGVRSASSSRPKSSMSSLSMRNKRGHLLLDSSLGLPRSPRVYDEEMNKQRLRITSAKGDPLFRRTGVYGVDTSDFSECGRLESSRLAYAIVSGHVDASLHKRSGDATTSDKPHGYVTTETWKPDAVGIVNRTTSFNERGKFGTRSNKVLQSPRAVLSVDNHPLHVQQDHPSLSRVVRPMPPSRPRKQKQIGELLRSSGQTTLNTINERSHPVAVMKLPPLETVKKTLPDRDLVCVGKEACV